MAHEFLERVNPGGLGFTVVAGCTGLRMIKAGIDVVDSVDPDTAMEAL